MGLQWTSKLFGWRHVIFFNLTRCCFFLKPCPGIQFHHVQWAHLQVTWCWLWCLQEWSSGRWLCIGWSIATLGWRHCTLAVVTAGNDEIEIRDMRSNCWQNGKTYSKWLVCGDFEMVWQLMLYTKWIKLTFQIGSYKAIPPLHRSDQGSDRRCESCSKRSHLCRTQLFTGTVHRVV